MSNHTYLQDDDKKTTECIAARVPPEVHAFIKGYSKAFDVTMSSAICAMLVAAMKILPEEDRKRITAGKKPERKEVKAMDQSQAVFNKMKSTQNPKR